MNKNLYRLVFNARRGQMMAVAETAGAQGKSASGETTANTITNSASNVPPDQQGCAQAAIKVIAVSMLHLALLTPVPAQAQIRADASAPGNQQPQIVTTANGLPQVNIQAPSAAGVSRNVYSQFDVNAQGAILNNSRTNVQTQLGGWVQSNGNLAGGAARVILNEVNSSNPSQLKGFVEVAGQRAEVIIANPSGIHVDGGGFINASGVTLTTGAAQINNATGGSLDSFRVQQGVVTINGAGLDTSSSDFTRILARAAQVNAGIWAKDLRVVTGSNEVNATTHAATAIAGTGAAPAFAIDVAALGGMYANKITLIGTEAGVGVNNAGTIAANGGDLVLLANGMLTNRGTIDGGATHIDATTVNNLGTGKIYGDSVSISATTLNNDTETVAGTTHAGVIAARVGRLDLGVGTLLNNEGAVIYSQGDLAIGGSLDANRQATGRATRITNNSATIEAQGALNITAVDLKNTYDTLGYRVETDPVTSGGGSCGGDCYTTYTQTTYRAVAVPGVNGPGKILSGTVLTLNTTGINLNDKSQILAGGALNISGTAVDNEGIFVALNIEQRGTTHQRRTERYWDLGWHERAWWEVSGYANDIPDNQTVTLGVKAVSANPNVGTAPANASVPTSSQYRINNGLGAAYLVETDPRFANNRVWMNSSYMLASLALDPSVTQKRLGDGFYEQRLINEQVAQLTGRRFLTNFSSDEAQYQGLMDSGITYAKAYNLRPGIALTAQQVAQLTSDIVWLVETEVTLKDGSHQKVLTPQVYVMVREGDLNTVGGLLSGESVNIATTGDVTNSGTILGRQLVQISANNLHNLRGTVQGESVAVNAATDVNNIGGTIAAQSSLEVVAGRDLNVTTTTAQTRNGGGGANAGTGAGLLGASVGTRGVQTSNQTVDRVAGLYVTKADGTLFASAGRDMNLIAAAIQSAGNTTLSAGNNLNLKTVTTSNSFDATIDADNFNRNSASAEVGVSIQSAGNTTLSAGNNLTARAANVQAGKELVATAVNNVTIEAGQATNTSSEGRTTSGNSFFSSSTTTDRKSSSQTQAIASNFSATSITGSSGQDLAVKGSNLTASQDVALTAGRDVTIESAQNTSASSQFSQKTQSGFSATDMGGLNVGTSQQAQEGTTQSTTQAASTVSGANVKVQAGRDATIKASNVLADQDITVTAQRDINVLAAANTQTSTNRSESSSTTIGLVGDMVGRQTFYGTTANMQDGSQTAVSQSTSVLSANKGNLTLVAANAPLEVGPSTVGTVTTQGAELLAGQTVTIKGAAVDLQAIKDATSSLSHSESKTFTIGAAPAGLIGKAVLAISDNIALSQNTQNSRLKDAAALKAGYDAYKMVSPTDAGASGGSADAGSVSQGIGVSIHLDSSSSSTDSAANKSMSRGTNVQAKDIVIQATQDDITATAAKLQAENITLDAAKNVNLIASANLETNTSSNSSNSAGVGVTFAVGGTQEGFSIQLRAAQAQGRSNGTETTYDNTQVTASKNLTVKSGTDTNLIGAQLAGETVKMEVGTSGTGKLNIETLQNTSTFKSEQSSSGFDVSLCIPPICYGSPAEFKLALAQQAIDHNYQSAVGQSGIAAGKGGFDIAVAGNTDLKGAAITSSASADKNTLATQSLTSSDLTNQQSTSSNSSSITVGNSASMAKTVLTNVLANLALQDGMPANGSQSSKTLSVISPATVTITGTGNTKTDAASDQQVALLTSRDASTANQTLTNTLTLQQAQGLQAKQQEAQENARAAQMVGEVTTSVVNDIAASQQRQLQVAENQRAQAANEKPAVIAAWGEGSNQKLALNALAGFVQASAAGKDGVAGAMNVLVMDVAAKGAKQIGDWATATDGKPAQIDAFMQAMSHAVLGCAAGAATAGNASGCTPGAVGAVVGELAAKFYNPTGKGDKTDTVAFAQTMAALAGAMVVNGTGEKVGQAGTIAASTGGNSAANNWLKHAEILDLIKAKNECQGGKGSANACVEVVRIEDLDKQRDKDLAAICINPANPACAIAQQDVRSAYAETLRAYVRGDLKELTIKDRIVYIGNQAHTEVMANTTLSTKDYVGSGLYTTGASALQGLADLANGIFTFGKAALGNEDARDKVGATTAGLAKLLSQPENWGALLERATDAQALKLADAYEKGDTKALGAMVGELAGGIVDPVAVFKGAKLGVKAAEGLQEYVAARKAAEALNPVEYVVIDVPSKFGQAGAITVGGYRIETVPAEMRVAYKNADYIDPIDNKVKSAPVGETMAVDHIYPSNLIVKRDGFDKLTKEQMTDILQDRIGLGNLQPLPASLNQSKGGRLGWGSGYKGGAIDTTYLANLVAKQDAILVKIDTQIQAYIKMNRVGSK